MDSYPAGSQGLQVTVASAAYDVEEPILADLDRIQTIPGMGHLACG